MTKGKVGANDALARVLFAQWMFFDDFAISGLSKRHGVRIRIREAVAVNSMKKRAAPAKYMTSRNGAHGAEF